MPDVDRRQHATALDRPGRRPFCVPRPSNLPIAGATAEGIAKSEIVRQALTDRLRKPKTKRKARTVHDLMGNLAGCIKDGPSDLSTNPKYMEGFGE
ncbi:MAG: hypothetical protein ACFCVE_12255 [Phycisphaerae bacterium]